MKRWISSLLIVSALLLPRNVLAENKSLDIASCIPETGSRIPVESAEIYATTTQNGITYHYVVLRPKDISQSLGIVLVEVAGNECKGHLVDFDSHTLPFENFVPASVAKELVDQANRNWNNRKRETH